MLEYLISILIISLAIFAGMMKQKKSRSNVTNQIHNDLIKEKGNDPKPSYAELEEKVKKLEREKAEILENSKTKSISQQPDHRKNDSIIDTAAKLYVLKFKFSIIGPLLAFIFGLILALIDELRLP